MLRSGHIRYSVVGLATAINLVCYADRMAIAVAGPAIQKDLSFSHLQMGIIFGIFSVAYALGQAPWGAVADRFGARRLVAGAIMAWSAFTTFTGLTRGFFSMLAIRFSFGALEAPLAPATAVAFTRWTPISERATAFSAFLSGGRLGAAIAPPIVAYLLIRFGWREMFVILGLWGIPAALAWLFWFRDDPAAHPHATRGEREFLAAERAASATPEPVSWSALLRSSRLWNLLAVSFTITFLWQFYITWFPTYLIEKRGLAFKQASFYAGLPFLLGAAGAWVGGLATDFLTLHFGRRRARLGVGCVGQALTATLMLIGMLLPMPRTAAFVMASAAFTTDLFLGAVWSSAVEIGGAAAGAVAGLNNCASNCAAFASPLLMGIVLQMHGSWNTLLLAGVAGTFAGIYFWTRVQAPVRNRNIGIDRSITTCPLP